MTTALDRLTRAGVSSWLDGLTREALKSGRLQELIDNHALVGIATSVPLLNTAIAETDAYDDQLRDHADGDSDAATALSDILVQDARDACDLLAPIVDRTGGVDGKVSVPVDPTLARDADALVSQARALWAKVDRPNLLVELPGTEEALPAIATCLAAGISVDVASLYSLDRYRQVADVYQTALEQRLATGESVANVASVASFPISDVDTEIDGRLEFNGMERALAIRGKLAIAHGRVAYWTYEDVIGAERWQRLREAGATPQRPRWVSTAPENPEYPDTIYVTELVAGRLVTTMSEATLQAVVNHADVVEDTIHDNYWCHEMFNRLRHAGPDFEDAVEVLEANRIRTLASDWTDLLAAVEGRLKTFR